MPRKLSLATLHKPLALTLILALAACQPQQSAPPSTTAALAHPSSAPPAQPAAPTAAAPAAAAPATADSVGVPECDDYLSRYQACVDNKVPEAARSAFKQSLDQTRASWRAAMAAPGGKEGMAAACKQAREAAKTSMGPYGCTDF